MRVRIIRTKRREGKMIHSTDNVSGFQHCTVTGICVRVLQWGTYILNISGFLELCSIKIMLLQENLEQLTKSLLTFMHFIHLYLKSLWFVCLSKNQSHNKF